MATQITTRKIPTPFYAAAGAGDLAYEQLRRLPERVAELRGRVNDLRPVVTEAVSEARRVDLDRFRETARRNVTAVRTGAQVAQERATAVYDDLVKRGRRVMRDSGGADVRLEIEPATGKVRTEVRTEPADTAAAKARTTRPASSTTPAAKRSGGASK